ncbi:pentaheme c-type cytochrome TorC [Vibrio sp. SM6]|uniref:Cytochrome c-type protein n=1 Tax=Vibrio agarilyticus TaxID=2726741 RepID=A0A7X8TR25_9VIBR|nr:pentaheme c-type cytochrome TorC [Vibrio agarilyticus]NLS13422.1 pentaheme c-type cytochrome TorC [Vibrio agarilyticus]
MKELILRIWRTLRKPAVHYSLGALTLGGFVAGVIFWGGFNTVLAVTNTEQFCISCHSMRDTVYPELQKTVHWKNRSGVRATCPDCHVPHNWTDKIARKIQASKEVYAAVFGIIDTPAKFDANRLRLAQNEWERFSANSSKECKHCHLYQNMDFDKMRPASRAQMMHAASTNQSCIDCHKGVAHSLPKQMANDNSFQGKLVTASESTDYDGGNEIYSIQYVNLYLDNDLKQPAGSLDPATGVKIIDESKDSVQIAISGWRKMKGYGRIIYADFGLNIPSASLSKEVAQSNTHIVTGEQKDDELTGLTWQKVEVDLWVKKADFVNDVDVIWRQAKESYNTNCSLCHTQPEEAHFDANTWPGMFDGMMGFVNFDRNTKTLVLKYLQYHSSDFVAH